MAEAIGLAASIIGVIELAKGVSTAVYNYGKAYKTAPKDINSLWTEILALIYVLERVKEESDDKGDGAKPKPSGLGAVGGPLWVCQDVLSSIKKKLPKQGTKIEGLKRLTWPFKDGEIKVHFVKLERAKSILELSMTVDQNVVMKEIQKMVEDLKLGGSEILRAVMSVQEGQRRLEGVIMSRQLSDIPALRWLQGNDFDFEQDHKEARRICREGTGIWFTEGTAFSEWLDGDTKLIWLHGIPGAGKTILMSTIISTAMEKLKPRDSTATAYFYFSFTETAKQKPVNMLKTVLTQLSTQVPSGFAQGVVELYRIYKNRTTQPDSSELVTEIKSVCEQLKIVYLFLDALDECSTTEQPQLFTYLGQLSKIVNLKIIATSRREADIEQALKENLFRFISIESSKVDHDISLFVQELLNSDKDIKRMNAKSKALILENLTSGAKGMFRWVECQIAPLKRCRNTMQVSSVLSKLPSTLYGTYDRILNNVPEDDKDYLRRALAWIMYCKRPLSVVELAEAMVVEPGSETLTEDSRLGEIDFRNPKPEEINNFISVIQSICGSLVKLEYSRFMLAHYSVQEYLTSDEVANGSHKRFSLRELEGNDVILEACTTYLQFEDFDVSEKVGWERTDIGRNFPLYTYAVCYWYKHVVSPGQDSSLLTRAKTLLQLEPPSGQFQLWSANFIPRYRNRKVRVDPEGGPLYFMSGLGMSAVVKDMIQRGASLDTPNHTAIHFAASRDCGDVIKVLVDDGGADIYETDSDGNTPIHVAVQFGCHKALAVLIERTKDFEVENVKTGQTPLAIALHEGGSDLATSMLLQAGAKHDTSASVPLLHTAVLTAKENRVRLLLESGADIDIKDNAGKTIYQKLLSIAHDGPSTAMRYPNPNDISENYVSLQSVLTLLHDRRADPKVGDLVITDLEFHMALIQYEHGNYHERMALSIIESGVDINEPFACCTPQETAFSYAIRCQYRSLVTKMVEMGADPNDIKIKPKGRLGRRTSETTLQYALRDRDPQYVSFLMDQGAGGENWLDSVPESLQTEALELAWHRMDITMCKEILDRYPKVLARPPPNTIRSPVHVVSQFLSHMGTAENQDFYITWIQELVDRGSTLAKGELSLSSVLGFHDYVEWKVQQLRPIFAKERFDIAKSSSPTWTWKKRCKLVKL